ncbi:MAG: hypothetical protein KJP25_08090 [Gammaproteobacteria bacterium]|nr:hypothetical protein [Gammaproteobacteria bacterium]MBT8152080.1 hypothetical protein [Gammaproteobacteria bacterium]NNM10344.1 hypothetical protein [Pseudomonadales bacterium]
MFLFKAKPAIFGALNFLLCCYSLGSSATTLDIDQGGNLLGATNVDVNGNFYDVSFQDGPCASLFDGCDDPSDFTFSTEVEALAASQVLLDEVFIDSGFGSFDSKPELTVGCESATECRAITVFRLSESNGVEGRAARNSASEASDQTASQIIGTGTNTTAIPTNVYAVWKLSNQGAGIQVPLPAGWIALLALMLAGLGIMRKRMNRRA